MTEIDHHERRGEEEERRVRQLLEDAGPRPEVSAEHLAEIKAAFAAEWVRTVGRSAEVPGRSGSAWWLAAAAAAVLAVLGGVAWLLTGDRWLPAPAEAVARVEALAGGVTVRPPSAEGALPPAASAELPAGTWITTAPTDGGERSWLTLRLEEGTSARFDADSRGRLLSASVIELERGTVYVDSPGAAAPVEVRTPLGVATEIGTQFEVRLLAAEPALRVRVREGAVRVEGPVGAGSAAAGDELTLSADGRFTRGTVEPYGEAWGWVVRSAPAFEVEGRTLGDFLGWVARETGWQVRFAEPAAASVYEATVLHGSIGGVPPDRAPGVVLPGAGLGHRVEDGVLWIEPRKPN